MAFDAQQLISMLLLAATALFLVAVAPGFRHRRAARIAAVALYSATLAGVIIYVGLWLFGAGF